MNRPLTADRAELIRELRECGASIRQIKATLCTSESTIRGVLRGTASVHSPSPRELFEADGRTGWQAACMDADDWRIWRSLAVFNGSEADQAARPCHDCPLSFALEMRAQGRCNGTPGEVSA